ncbi:hypothetical protein ACFWH4_07720, partial [Streptomyces sp. NPDC127091]|uniref:hypothetical protein n=1 Tax=Streptomyces sp. NPDC127091 TaxID=3347134 RepID=UPI0036610E8D
MVVVVEPGQPRPGVGGPVHRGRRRRLTRDAPPLGRRHQVDEHPAGGPLGPVRQRPVVLVDLLPHRTADTEPHGRGGPARRLTYWGSTDARVCGWTPP